MGRRKDNPLEQAAKGYPGRRKSKVEKEIEAVARAASAELVPPDDPWQLPGEFKRSPAYYRKAIEIWQRQSEVLRIGGRRRPAYIYALTRYCQWQQHWHDANESVRKFGLTVKHVKGDGNEKVQANPAFDLMKAASVELRLLEDKFGFTPSANQDLLRSESFNASQKKFDFDPENDTPRQNQQAAPAAVSDPMDLMNATDSAPPSGLMN